jgi:CubicO group peptidase (beta-lactamase class C family)
MWMLGHAAVLCFGGTALHRPLRQETSPLGAEQVQRIDALFAPWSRPASPGCALGLVIDGRLAYARGYGSANLEHEVPITSRTVFDIASTSKQITAACIGLLVQEGRLAPSDDVRRFVPELPDYGTTITLEHLLRHTSGLRDYLTLFALAGVATEDLTGPSTALALLARQTELEFQPGTEHSYSNSGYFLLSMVVERASGSSLAEFARRRIFEPLGMLDTHFHDDHATLVPRRATGHAPRGGDGFALDMSDFEQVGDGGVLTTVEDLARWDGNFYAPTVGGAALLEFLREPGTLADGTALDYGRGLYLGEHEGLVFESHGGAWAGYRSDVLRFPGERTTVIVLANLASIDPTALCWRVAAILLGDRLPPDERPRRAHVPKPPKPPFALTSEAARALAGDYACEELGVVYTIALARDALRFGLQGRDSVALKPVAADVLDALGALLCFERDVEGRPTGFTLEAGSVRNLRCVRVR